MDPSTWESGLIAWLSIHSTDRIIMATYLSPLTIIDIWVFRRVTDRTEDHRFARVGLANDEDPEATDSLRFLKSVLVFSVDILWRVRMKSSRAEKRGGSKEEGEGIYQPCSITHASDSQ